MTDRHRRRPLPLAIRRLFPGAPGRGDGAALEAIHRITDEKTPERHLESIGIRVGRRPRCSAALHRAAPWRLIACGALLALALAFAAPPAPRSAFAHDFAPHTYLDIRVMSGRLEGRLSAHIADLTYEGSFARPESLLVRTFAERHLATLHRVLADRFRVTADGRAVRPRWKSFFIVPSQKLLAFEWEAPIERAPSTVVVEGPFFTYDRWHETYVFVHEHGKLRHQDLLDRNRTRSTYYTGTTTGRLEVVKRFVFEGVRHVAIGPDHILFILGLVLPGGGLWRLVKIVTAFTIAHSITLALATLRIVDPPAQWIEPIIAASVAVIGIEALFAARRIHDWRASIAFGFGLVHGFGFAGVLRDVGLAQGALGWSLAAFNGGVELAQVGIVLAVAPALAALRARRPEAAGRVVRWSAIAITLAGVLWLIERLR